MVQNPKACAVLIARRSLKLLTARKRHSRQGAGARAQAWVQEREVDWGGSIINAKQRKESEVVRSCSRLRPSFASGLICDTSVLTNQPTSFLSFSELDVRPPYLLSETEFERV